MNNATTRTPDGAFLSLPDGVFEGLRDWFESYIDPFLSGRPEVRTNLVMKAEHSRRVAAEMRSLGADLELGEGEQRVASLVGLLHDIGRFEQYLEYRTFDDRRSINHAELGLVVLRRDVVLHAVPEKTCVAIRKAILYHNRRVLPEEEPAATLLLSRMIRDTDKLDILRICVEEYTRTDGGRNAAIGIDLPDTPGYSPSVAARLSRGETVDSGRLRNLNDFKLSQLGWVFDVNFAPTFRRIQSRGYIKHLCESIREGGTLQRAFENVHQHVERGIAKQ